MLKRSSTTALLLLALCAISTEASAQALTGTVQDALTGTPIPGAEVRVLQTGDTTTTDARGRYTLHAPPGDWTLWVQGPSAVGGRGIFAHQQARARLATLNILGLDLHTHLPSMARPYGLPSDSGRMPAEVHGPLDARSIAAWWLARRGLDEQMRTRLALDMPMPLPSVVRVARRFAGSCRDNPIQRIDTVPIEEYVHGVLLPEIGVFKSAATGQESSRAVFKAFAVAARTYALYFVVRGTNDAEGYDLDDTACNQRYDDQRDPWVEALVAETAGEVLVQAGTVQEFDKFEYAASCGRHSSWPEYQEDYVSDAGLQRVCVGNWCGHDNCAAHQDNPEVPGDDRCLVRGVCQWGAMERSALGHSYKQILTHYQPNLDVRNFAMVPPEGGTVRGFVRAGTPDGPPVPGAQVRLDGGDPQSASDTGSFEFIAVEAGPHSLRATAAGHEPAQIDIEALEGGEVSAILIVQPTSGEDPTPDVVPEPDPTPDANPAPEPDTDEAPGNDFPLFGEVSGEGLGGGGGCAVSGGPPPGSGIGLVALLGVLVWRRPRSKRPAFRG